jgi:hypothetical protein
MASPAGTRWCGTWRTCTKKTSSDEWTQTKNGHQNRLEVDLFSRTDGPGPATRPSLCRRVPRRPVRKEKKRKKEPSKSSFCQKNLIINFSHYIKELLRLQAPAPLFPSELKELGLLFKNRPLGAENGRDLSCILQSWYLTTFVYCWGAKEFLTNFRRCETYASRKLFLTNAIFLNVSPWRSYCTTVVQLIVQQGIIWRKQIYLHCITTGLCVVFVGGVQNMYF